MRIIGDVGVCYWRGGVYEWHYQETGQEKGGIKMVWRYRRRCDEIKEGVVQASHGYWIPESRLMRIWHAIHHNRWKGMGEVLCDKSGKK